MPTPNEKQYSYADYLEWPEDERWEIIDGVPYMQAAPSPLHQFVLGELYRQFSNYLLDKTCKAYPAPFCVRLTKDKNRKNEDIKKVVEPDITIICDKSKIDEKGCIGVPDMIIEVLSPSSVKMDRLIKLNAYEKAGVREYWIVEPENKLVSVYVLQNNGKYGRNEVFSDTDKIKVSIFQDLEINLSTVFDF